MSLAARWQERSQNGSSGNRGTNQRPQLRLSTVSGSSTAAASTVRPSPTPPSASEQPASPQGPQLAKLMRAESRETLRRQSQYLNNHLDFPIFASEPFQRHATTWVPIRAARNSIERRLQSALADPSIAPVLRVDKTLIFSRPSKIHHSFLLPPRELSSEIKTSLHLARAPSVSG